MKIGELNKGLIQLPDNTSKSKSKSDDFNNLLTSMIKDVNDSQNNAADLTKKFIEGDDVELHEVMIAGEKAKTSLQLLMEIRNKAVDMYKELIRMPV
jgi:flagellar hook-basal body complex protein FliE